MKQWIAMIALAALACGCSDSGKSVDANEAMGEDERQALIQERTDELVEHGVPPTEAREQAEREYGVGFSTGVDVYPSQGAAVSTGVGIQF